MRYVAIFLMLLGVSMFAFGCAAEKPEPTTPETPAAGAGGEEEPGAGEEPGMGEEPAGAEEPGMGEEPAAGAEEPGTGEEPAAGAEEPVAPPPAGGAME